MNLLKFLRRERTTANFAKERLQIIVSHQNSSNIDEPLVEKLQTEILAAISKIISINQDQISIQLNQKKSTLNLTVNLAE